MNFLLSILMILVIIIILLVLIFLLFLMDEPSIRVFYRTVIRDAGSLILYLRIYLFMKYCQFRNLSVIDLFNQNVKKYPNKTCFIFEDEEWTYKQVDNLSNKTAQFFLRQGYQKGDEVALLMANCPEYICFLLGLGKIGVRTALINTNLKTESLVHSLNEVNMKGLIFGQSFGETLQKAMPYIQKADTCILYCYTRISEEKTTIPFPCQNLNVRLESVPALPLDTNLFKINFQDKFLYIYTSGTSGLPKAAIMTHRRFLHCARCIHCLISSVKSRVFYNTLPLYHIAGLLFYLSGAFLFGDTTVIKKKFSASNFWKDVKKYNVSIFVYIGEICRYLLNQPKSVEDFGYSLEVMLGIGLRSHVWKELQERFKIKKIIELYGSTEGNLFLANYYGKVGSVGVISRLAKLQGAYLIKVNDETGEIMRDSSGLCIPCKPGEPGELVGSVSRNHPFRHFDGYTNKAESNRKIIRNCFKEGDMYFASGDLLVMDEDGFLYFKDRLGDTFRWKGENVSSTEVETILSKLLNFATCIVYGVEIPGTEGKIGMAAIQKDFLNDINFDRLYEDMVDRLPKYAIPAFLRLSSTIDETGTYKLQKSNFRKQGYNPQNIKDPLYVLDVNQRTYVPLTHEIYNNIIKGEIKF